jgi:hypothetical protein
MITVKKGRITEQVELEGLGKNKKKAGQRGEIGRKDNKIKDNSWNIQCMVMGEYINIKHDLTEYKNQHKLTLSS